MRPEGLEEMEVLWRNKPRDSKQREELGNTSRAKEGERREEDCGGGKRWGKREGKERKKEEERREEEG